MFSVKKAENSKSDIETINRLAWLAFPATYRGLLTPDQIVFMMNWMYSPANISGQMQNNHTYFICIGIQKNAGIFRLKSRERTCFISRKFICCPNFKVKELGN